MRGFSKRVLWVFIAFIVLVSVGLGLLFWYISNNYFNSKTSEQLHNVNVGLSFNLDQNIDMDHSLLTTKLDEVIGSGVPVSTSFSNKDNWKLRGLTPVKYGDIVPGGQYRFDFTNIYVFADGKKEAYDFNVSMFSYVDALSNASVGHLLDSEKRQTNIYFKLNDNYFISYNALDYLATVFPPQSDDNDVSYNYYITNSDMIIYATNDANSKGYFDSPDHLSPNSLYTLGLADRLNSADASIRNSVDVADFKGIKSYISRCELNSDLLRDGMFVFTVYDYDKLSSSTLILSIVLISIFVAIILINTLLSFYVMSKVRKKVDSADGKNSYLSQIKTYSVEIGSSGGIRGFNSVFKSEFPDCTNLKSIREMEILSDLSVDIILSNKESFVGAFHKGQNKYYIKFEFVKSMFKTLLIGQDVTALVSDFEVSQTLAYRNHITDLPNKNSLIKSLGNLFSKPDFLDHKNSLVIINIQKFRNVNQIVGTRIADTIIVDLSKEIISSLQEYNINFQVYHTIADNFIILFENVRSSELVVEWVQKFLDARKRRRNITTILDIELKIGIYHLARSEEYSVLTVDDAYASVIEALNAAKESSTNMAVFDSKLGQVASRRKIMERDLIEAVKHEEFVMYLQPQLSTVTNRIVGFEALLRWDNPKYINESPHTFITIAESSGLIIDIGKIIIKKTFELAKEFSKYGICISMNVSPVQILQAGFASQMVEEFRRNGLQPGQVSVEITETFLISSFDLIISKIKIIKDQGISIHLDDFGTGYSSLLYLKELPINTIKIDRGFVQHLENDRYSKSIVSMICNLCKNLGFDIIVEGVERQSQVAILSKYGADIIQGYLVSKPVPKAEAIALLERYNGGK